MLLLLIGYYSFYILFSSVYTPPLGEDGRGSLIEEQVCNADGSDNSYEVGQ